MGGNCTRCRFSGLTCRFSVEFRRHRRVLDASRVPLNPARTKFDYSREPHEFTWDLPAAGPLAPRGAPRGAPRRAPRVTARTSITAPTRPCLARLSGQDQMPGVVKAQTRVSRVVHKAESYPQVGGLSSRLAAYGS